MVDPGNIKPQCPGRDGGIAPRLTSQAPMPIIANSLMKEVFFGFASAAQRPVDRYIRPR